MDENTLVDLMAKAINLKKNSVNVSKSRPERFSLLCLK